MSFDKSDQGQSNQQQAGGFEQNAGQAGDSQPFLVIGDRAFATKEDVEKYYTNANTHIEKLEQENKSYRDERDTLEKAANENLSARELLEGIKSATSQPASSETPSISQEEVVAQAVTIAKNEIKEELKSEAQQNVEKSNMTDAMQAAKEYYGDDYINKVNEVGKEHGLDGKAINNLAKQSPKAFAGLFLPKIPGSAGPTGGDYNAAAFNQQPKTENPSFMKMTTVKDRAAEVQRRILAKEKELNG